MHKPTEILNDILIGEHMAIENYQIYIDSIADSPLRNHLTAIVTDHKSHATRLSYFIQTNGGYVKEGTGFKGTLNSVITKVSNDGPIKMLQTLYEGEEMGILKVLEMSKGLDASEKEIVESIIEDEKGHLKQLKRLQEDLIH